MAQNQERRVEMNKSSRTPSGRGSFFARFTNRWMTCPGLGMKAFGSSWRFSTQLWRSSRRAQLVQKGGHSPSHLRQRRNRGACLPRSIAPLHHRTSQHQQIVRAGDDVLRSACNGGWVIVDGLDRSFSNGAYQAVAHLVTALVSDDTLFFRMLVTSQQQEWARVTDRLADYNAVVAWDPIPVGTFSDADLKQVADMFPALRGVMLRGRLAGVLRNPKVLDVVVRRLVAEGVVVGKSMIHDEASFASWFYDCLVRGSGGGRASRGRLVMHLAEIQGDRLQAETPLRDLDASTLDHIDDLERDGVCEEHDGQLRFGHDLYGDWVRYQLLRSHHDELPDYLRGRLNSPLWHRAIRLHSLAMLAAHQAEEWRAEMRRLGGDTLGLLHDVFLEAPLFAAEPGPALEKVWPVLIDGDGRLLRRLLRRFLHSATVPNQALLATVRDIAPDLDETHVATMQRLPYWPLWLPLLGALSVHADDALEVADDEVARLVDVWLRTVPDTWPLRSEVAALAIARGRHVLEGRRTRRYGAEDRQARAWRAVLATVRERHDDVVEIVSALTRPGGTEDEEVDDESTAHGQRGVDHVFSDACLNTDALHPVIATDPKLAGDILFAILAPRPRRRSRFGGDLPWDKLGMDRLPGWLIPLYTRGPFLAFLRTAPAEARAFTLRLVEAATDRWIAVRPDGGAFVSEIKVPIGDARTLTVRGDEQVLQWYRGDSRVPSTLASALMSLEKWLYDEADAGHDIGPVVRELLESATSVAIVGLLTALGCRHPELLQGPLRPLLGVPELYLWDRWYKSVDQSHLLIGLVGEPAQVRQLAHEWYSLEHRRTTLMEVAQRLMLTDHDVAAFLVEARGRWRERLDDQGEPARLRFLIAGLDPANWKEKTHPQGFSYWEYEEPEELRAESQRAVQEVNQRAFWLMMPMRCRKILDGELSVREEDLEELWDTVQSQALIPPGEDGSDESVISREDTECGLAAVLMVRHREWLRRHPERERWCIDRMVEAVSATRERHWSDSPESGIAWLWDAFCADAFPIRWAEQPKDPLLREAIVRLALDMHYTTITRLFAAAGQRRDALGDDFRQLQHLAVHIACFRVAMEVAHDDGAREQAVAALSPHIDGVVNATLEPVVPAWADLAAPDGPIRRGWFKLDPAYLQAAYAWMPPLDAAHDQGERAEWIDYWHQSVQALVRRLQRNIDPHDGEVEGTPYEPEFALLRALPARIIQMRPDEARAIWEPILALGGIAHYWVESFLDHWFMVGLQTIPTPDEFVREWQAMLDYTEGAEAWSGARQSYHVAELRRRLMGLGEFVLDLWTEGQAQVVAKMAPHYDRWAHQSLDGSQDATQLARFLRRPGATPLVTDGLIWLAAAEGSASSSRADNHYEDAVGMLLSHVARHQRDIPRSTGPVGDAYRALLRRLADRQVPIALELASRLSSLTGLAWDS